MRLKKGSGPLQTRLHQISRENILIKVFSKHGLRLANKINYESDGVLIMTFFIWALLCQFNVISITNAVTKAN